MESTHRLYALLKKGYTFKMSHYFKQGFQLYRDNFKLFLGFGTIYALILYGSSSVPFFGLFGYMVLYGPFAIGAFYVAHQAAHKKDVVFNDFFKGFNHFGTLLLQILVACLLWILLSIPFWVFFTIEIIKIAQEFQQLETAVDTDIIIDAFKSMNWLLLIALIIVPYMLMIMYRWASAFTFFYNSKAWDGLEWSRKFIVKQFVPFLGMTIILGIMAYGISTVLSFYYLKTIFTEISNGSFSNIAANPDALIEQLQGLQTNNWILMVSNIPYIFIIPFICCVQYVAFADATQLNKHIEMDNADDFFEHLVE